MKTKTFIEKVEGLGFLVHDGHGYLEVKDIEGKDVVDILKAKRWIYDCEFEAFESLHEVKQTELMEIVTEYVTTQTKDREEEKRYRLKLASKLFTESIENIYLNQNLQALDRYYINSALNGLGMKTIFTESEIAQMDITGFEKEEVE